MPRIKAKRSDAGLPNFESHLLTVEVIQDPSLVMDIMSEIIPDSVQWLEQVSSCLLNFMDSFVTETSRVAIRDIPEYVESSEKRLSLFSNLIHSVLTQMERNCQPFLLNGKNHFVQANESPNINVTSIGFMLNETVIDIAPLVRGYPRAYGILYKAFQLLLIYLQNGEYKPDYWITKVKQFLVLALSIGNIHETVLFTEQEKRAKIEEFLLQVSQPSPPVPQEVVDELDLLFQDIEAGEPYVHDLKLALSTFNRTIKGRKWSPDDASFSLNSSGSRLQNGRVPPNALFYSMVERDLKRSHHDDVIGFVSTYPTQEYPGLEQHPVTSTFVPKTSSRGVRAIHSPDNATQDRGAYAEKPGQRLINSLINDCTKMQSLGVSMARLATSLEDTSLGIVNRDLKSSTDLISINAVRAVWTRAFGPEFTEFLIHIYCGPGYLRVKGKTFNYSQEYTQTRGIRQGIKGVFELGLSFMHHIAIRIVMRAMDLTRLSPERFARILGDDSLATPMLCSVYNYHYERVMNAFGFEVHPLVKKGYQTLPGSDNRLAEFSKQLYRNGEILSRIPLKLFFKPKGLMNRLNRILWLTKYDCFRVGPDWVDRILATSTITDEYAMMVRKTLTFFGKHQIMNVPQWEMFEFTEDEEVLYASTFCYIALRYSIVKQLLNPRDRLTPSEEELKRNRFEELLSHPERLKAFEDFYQTHCPEFTSKFHQLRELNGILEVSINNLLSDDPLVDFGPLLSFTEAEREMLRNSVDMLNHISLYRNLLSHEDLIKSLLRGKEFILSIQPHNLQKSHSGISDVLHQTIVSLMNEGSRED